MQSRPCKDSEGFYDWADINGNVRKKYTYHHCINVKTKDGYSFFLGSSTYLDEYEAEEEEAEFEKVKEIEPSIAELFIKTVDVSKQLFDEIKTRDINIIQGLLTEFMKEEEHKKVFIEGDREKLYLLSQELFEKNKEFYGVTHFYYETLNDTVFLRIHNKNIYNDLITRITYDQSKKSKSWGSGIELGKTAFALRVVHPYYLGEEQIGYVEFGQEIDHFIEEMKTRTGFDYGVIVQKKYIDPQKWAEVREVKNLRNNYDDLKEYVIIDTTRKDQFIFSENCFSEEDIKKISDSGNVLQTCKVGDKTFISGGFALYDAGADKVGAIVVIDEITEFISEEKGITSWIIYILIGIIILITLFYFLTKNKKEKLIVRTFSIRKKLFLAFGILVMLMIISGIFSIMQSRAILEEEVGNELVLLAEEKINAIDRIIYRRTEITQAYAFDLAYEEVLINSNNQFDLMQGREAYIEKKDREWKNAKQTTTFMQNIIENSLSKEIKEEFELKEFYTEVYGFPIFVEVFVTNKYGVNIAQTQKTSDYYQADEEWWQKAKQKGQYVSEVLYDESAGMHSIEIAVPLEDKEKNFLGVIKVVYNIKEIIQIIKGDKLKEHKTEYLELINKNGKLVYATKEFEIFSAASELPKEKLIDKQSRYWSSYSTILNKEAIYSHAHSNGYKTFEGIGLSLFIIHEKEEILAPVNKVMKLILTILIVTIIISIFLSLYFSKSITNPIRKLYQSTTEIEKGNFDINLDIKSGDELEQLGLAFNKTAKALKKMDEEHKQVERAKTEFLSITSHELRSPMTPMRAQLQMLQGDFFGKLNSKQKESVEIVLRNTERLDRIIVDFLEISRIEAARLKFNFVKEHPLDGVKRLLKEMDGFLPEKKIKIATKFDKLPIIELDPDRVCQILRNLINNAKKFSPPNSTIELTVRLVHGMIQFSVKDQGIGLKPEDLRRVFEPFYQVGGMYQRKSGGTGLGLAICRGIAESQNGKIWVESEYKKGTTFSFTIPLKPVKNIKSIKLLFSSQIDVEKRLNIIFKKYLGPLGEQELKTLKEQKGITEKAIKTYISELDDQGILSKEIVEKFKNTVYNILTGKSKEIGTQQLLKSGLIANKNKTKKVNVQDVLKRGEK